MNRIALKTATLVATLLLASGTAPATTREVANLQAAPLTLRQSVIGQLSAGVLADPYDELLHRPFNLGFANIERHANLSPWPGQAGEQDRYVDFLIGNNGNANVRNGADTLQGTYIGQSMEKFTWGVSAAFLADDRQNEDTSDTTRFGDGEKLTGHDVRLAAGYRVTNRIVIGAGLSAFERSDETTDTSVGGSGGLFSLQELQESAFEADFGLRLFSGESGSWSARLRVGSGDTDLNDFSDDLDDAGAVVTRVVNKEYAISDQYAEISGGYNRRFVDGQGEMQVHLGYRTTDHELDNDFLAYRETGGAIEPTLELLDQDPVSKAELFASADTLFVRGWTQIFAGARVSASQTDGSSQADSLSTIVNESIDDSRNNVALVLGLRQPLGNERFSLVARARADWLSTSQETVNDGTSSVTDRTQTTTGFALGIETVLNNMAFDLAWLFGGDPAPGGVTEPTRQTVDLDRLVFSATFGW